MLDIWELCKFVINGVVLLVLTLLIYYTLLSYNTIKRYSHIPGAPCNNLIDFYFGQLFYFLRRLTNKEIYVDIIQENFKKYGPVIKTRMLNQVIVYTTDATALKEIFVTEDFMKHPDVYRVSGWPLNERLLGNGLVTEVDKKAWYSRRAIFNHSFQRSTLKDFLNEFNGKGDLLIERLRLLADDKTPVTLLTEFNHAALDIIANISLGMHLDTITNCDSTYNKYLTDSFRGTNLAYIDPFIQYKPHRWNEIKQLKQAMRSLRELTRNQILSRLKAIENDEPLPNDMLTITLKSYKDECSDIELLVDDFVTFFAGGQETTANTLSFVFMELGRNPDVLQKLKSEIESVLGRRREIKFEDLSQLKYEGAIIKETLRLYPPIPLIIRKTTKEMTINGCTIPTDTIIAESSYCCARCEEYFPNPLKFEPERFLNDDESTNNKGIVPNYTYFPFSLGSRNCIGQNFAQIESKVLITKIIQNFDFKLDPNQSLKTIQIGTLRPEDGTRCIFKVKDS